MTLNKNQENHDRIKQNLLETEALKNLLFALNEVKIEKLPSWAKMRVRDLKSSIYRVLEPRGPEYFPYGLVKSPSSETKAPVDDFTVFEETGESLDRDKNNV